MKKTKLFNVLIPTATLATVAGMVLPLAACACQSTKIKLTSESHKTADASFQAVYTFETDREYKTIDVEIESDYKFYFEAIPSIEGKVVNVTIKLKSYYHPYINKDLEVDFDLKFNGEGWSDKVKGLSIKLLSSADKDKTKVNNINNIIKGTPISTMSQLLTLLELNGINLEEETTTSDTAQWVWDCTNSKVDGGVVFVMNEDGTVKAAPDGYKLPDDEVNLWRMVSGETTLKSSNKLGVKKDKFRSDAPYSQFLRTGETFNENLEFISGLDTGSHDEGFNLTFNRDSGTINNAIINTQNCELTVTSASITEVQHYGHLKTLTVQTLPADGTYSEWGTVDARVVLNSGTFSIKPEADVSEIVIESNDVKKVEVEDGSSVGSVYTTTDVTKTASQLIEGSGKSDIELIDDTPKDPATTPRYAAGLGSVAHPYVISEATHLLNCQEDVNVNSENNANFILLNDIDMTGVTTFTGIGNATNPFKGTFDGQDYTISNLTISQSVDPSVTDNVYAALFGYIKGNPISGCDRTKIWDNTEKKVNYDTCLTKYTTYVKNIKIASIDNTVYGNVASRYIGGIAGRVSDALVYNCHVNAGSIKGKKHLGGIAGTMSNSLFYDCSTGSGLSIECTEYNCGGICGSASAYAESKASCDVFGYCVNNASVSAKSTAEVNGNVSGICALAGGSDTAMGTVFDNCINNGKITSQNTTGTGRCPSPSGICSDAHRTLVCSNCVNNGEIKIEDGYTSQYASGIISYSQARVYKCQNKGKVWGSAGYMAGILAYQSSDYFVINEFYDVGNSGEIINTKGTGSYTGPIVAAENANVIIIDKVYDSVDQLNSEISSAGGVSITLKNVTVNNTQGTLNILPAIMSVTSDKKVCSNVAIAGSSVTIDMPDTNITVDGDHSSTLLYVHGNHSNLIVNEGASLLAATVGGDNSTLTNYGTIQSVTMTNRCVESTNQSTGFIGNIGFDNGNWKESTPLTDKRFVNYGTVHTQGRTCHTIATVSDVKITFENYNIIKSENSWYLYLFYTPQNCVIKNYAGSVAEIAGTSSGLCATHETVISYYQEAKGSKEEAKVIDKGVEKKWTDYTWYFEHHKIED